MREIKFRAWDKVENTMCYFDNPHWILDTLKLMFGDNGLHVYNLQNGSGGDDYELMQYTGLKDKNGKEIYEGDIVKRPNGDTGDVIWFKGGYWGVNSEFSDWSYMFDCNEPENHEVIGNIYESKELLQSLDKGNDYDK